MILQFQFVSVYIKNKSNTLYLTVSVVFDNKLNLVSTFERLKLRIKCIFKITEKNCKFYANQVSYKLYSFFAVTQKGITTNQCYLKF